MHKCIAAFIFNFKTSLFIACLSISHSPITANNCPIKQIRTSELIVFFSKQACNVKNSNHTDEFRRRQRLLRFNEKLLYNVQLLAGVIKQMCFSNYNSNHVTAIRACLL